MIGNGLGATGARLCPGPDEDEYNGHRVWSTHEENGFTGTVSTGEPFRNYITYLYYFGVKATIAEVSTPLIIGRYQTPIARVSRYYFFVWKSLSLESPVISTTIGLLLETFTLATSIWHRLTSRTRGLCGAKLSSPMRTLRQRAT